jgi:hypothetical protein
MAGPGYAWVAPAVKDLRASWRPAAVAADDGGPAREVTDELNLADVPVHTLTMRDFSTACGRLLSRIQSDDMSHDGSDLLASSIAGLVARPSSDGIVFSRRHSTGDTSGAIALTVGAHVLERVHGDQRPLVEFGAA